MKIYVTKRFTFEASHILTMHPGKCKNLHGHSYKLFVTVSSPLNDKLPDKGYFVDFGELSNIVHACVVNKVDHAHLNDLPHLKDKQTTAENLAVYIWAEVTDYILTCGYRDDFRVEEIKLYETEDSYVTIRR